MKLVEKQQRIQNAKNLDFGTLLSQSIELFKKVWVQGLVTLLLNLVLAIPFIMVVYIPLIFMGFFEAYSSSYDMYDPYLEPEFSPMMIFSLILVYMFLLIAMSTIGFGLKAAFYRICKLKDLNQIGSEDYFYFFKKPYLAKTIKLGLAFSGISIVATLLCFFPLIYVIVPLSFMVIVYGFNPDLSISEIITLGFALGNKKWLIAFGLMIVSGFLAGIVGMLMCCIGIYVTASFSYLPHYFIYKDVIGFDDEEALERLDS
ncbi:MAG: hypothetical protein NWP87_03895 [Winogradskyella sp.]|nr:hypothetical protein [Winogradskyella sp.]